MYSDSTYWEPNVDQASAKGSLIPEQQNSFVCQLCTATMTQVNVLWFSEGAVFKGSFGLGDVSIL